MIVELHDNFFGTPRRLAAIRGIGLAGDRHVAQKVPAPKIFLREQPFLVPSREGCIRYLHADIRSSSNDIHYHTCEVEEDELPWVYSTQELVHTCLQIIRVLDHRPEPHLISTLPG